MQSSIWQVIWDNSLATGLLVFQLTGLFMAARVILGDRSTQGTIAWVLSLVLLPLVAVPLYAMFGRNRLESYIEARRRVDRDFARLNPVDPEKVDDTGEGEDTLYPSWDILGNLAKVGMTRGNAVDLIFTGRETFDSIHDGIQRAQDYILFQFFIFRDDEEGRRFVDLLKAKAAAGVHVHFLVDAIGSKHLKQAFFTELKEAGIETGRFLPGRSLRGRLRLNFRNHRKVVVVDGKEAWIGGHNIGIEYANKHPVMTPWRDTHAWIRGPVVNAVQLAFLEDWFWVMRSKPALNWNVSPPQSEKVKGICLATGPTDPDDTCTIAYVHMINQAKQRLWIQSPYFVPADEVITALQLATIRGVDVRILLPRMRDHFLVWISSFYFSALPQLRKVRFMRYREGFFHSKMMLVDDDLLTVGTVNFDNRSFRINFEITLVLHEEALVESARDQMERDFVGAVEDPVDPLATRSIAFRLAARTARLFSPLL